MFSQVVILIIALQNNSLLTEVTSSYGSSLHYFFISSGDVTFSQVVMEVMRQLEGAYALIFKSPHYPNELIACKRGSQLILGVNVSEITSLYSLRLRQI